MFRGDVWVNLAGGNRNFGAAPVVPRSGANLKGNWNSGGAVQYPSAGLAGNYNFGFSAVIR